MLLSVITPDDQPGMAQMLARELDGIDAEIIINNWDDGLKQAKGNFVCFLEKNSAVETGSIRDNLATFTEKPAYRKLAMVSPRFDVPSMGINSVVWTGYHEGLNVNGNPRSGNQPTRIGFVPGAVIRKSSLIKSGIKLNPLSQSPLPDEHYSTLAISCMLSIYFWENGLRVHLNADAVYYSPEKENVSYWHQNPTPLPVEPSPEVQDIWQHEMIS